MGEFFKGWRRKAGLVTLAMACVLFVAWMRSYVVADVIWFVGEKGEFLVSVISIDGQVGWQLLQGEVGGRMPFLFSWDKSKYEFDELLRSMRDDLEISRWIAPYWSIVIPLTLLSAWLILGKKPKPRAAPPNLNSLS